MKCLLWYKEKENKEPKLYMKLVGEKERMCVVLKAMLKALCS
jgi:hypothetical protein